MEKGGESDALPASSAAYGRELCDCYFAGATISSGRGVVDEFGGRIG